MKSQLRKQSPEAQLAELILSAFDSGVILGIEWEGQARELKALLTLQGAEGSRDAEKLLSAWNGATGAYLTRIVAKSAEYEREMGLRVVSLGQRQGVERYGLLRLTNEGPDGPEGERRSEGECF